MAATVASASPLTSESQDSFVALPMCAFHFPGTTDVDLYRLMPDKSGVQLVCTRARGLAPNELEQLAQRGVHSLLVRQSEYPQVTTALFASLDAVATATSVIAGERLVLVQAAVCDQLDAAHHLLKCDPFVRLAQRTGSHIATLVKESKLSPRQTTAVLQHRPSHAVHATNTAVYSVQLAVLLGEQREQTLVEIAVGAILHDLRHDRRASSQGYMAAWTDGEDARSGTSRPQHTYEQLAARSDISHGQLMMAYQHQEAIDGSGYPVGILGDEIHPWARLLAVVDRFDTLTSDREPAKSIGRGGTRYP